MSAITPLEWALFKEWAQSGHYDNADWTLVDRVLKELIQERESTAAKPAIINRVVVRCEHEFGHRARVTARKDHVLVEYGTLDSENRFQPKEVEKLMHSEHDELLYLCHDDCWDAMILAALVDTFCED